MAPGGIPDVTTPRLTWPPVLGTRPLAPCVPALQISIAQGCILLEIWFPCIQECNANITWPCTLSDSTRFVFIRNMSIFSTNKQVTEISSSKIETIYSSETSGEFQWTARCYIPDDSTVQ